MSTAYEEALRAVCESSQIPWSEYDGSTVVVTGSTGLIGGLISRALMRRSDALTSRIRVILPVRNIVKARSLLGGWGQAEYVLWDARDAGALDLGSCDYIIHCASNTDSRLMTEKPVDTIEATLHGTTSMLEVACTTGAHMVFASSMEVYGAGDDAPISESAGGALDAMNPRSSYPLSKQMAESLCTAYTVQYETNACVARLAQTFGPGVSPADRRVFAEFARCCADGRDIVLLTDGSKSNMYLHVADAASALLLLAAQGEAGEAYNVANETTFCSIREMAEEVASNLGQGTKVTRAQSETDTSHFRPAGKIWLDTSKLRALGWEPMFGLMDMYHDMVDDWSYGNMSVELPAAADVRGLVPQI